MKILVCFKTVPDFDQVVDADWESFSLATNLSYVKRSFGCFDEIALETALHLKDSLQNQCENVECAALTLGPLPALFRKTLYAVGFAHVWNAEAPEKNIEFRPQETARFLSYAIKNLIAPLGAGGPWDIILAGRQAGYADSGMVPLLLAEHLNIPVITEAERLSPTGISDGEKRPSVREIAIERMGETGRECVRIQLPVLAVMGNSPVATLRAATLATQMQAAKHQPETLPHISGNIVSDNIPAALPPEESPQLFRTVSRKNCRFLSDENTLLQNVQEIAAYLQEWGNR